MNICSFGGKRCHSDMDEERPANGMKDAEIDKQGSVRVGSDQIQVQEPAEVHSGTNIEIPMLDPSTHYFDGVQSCFVDIDGNPIKDHPISSESKQLVQIGDQSQSCKSEEGDHRMDPSFHEDFEFNAASPQFSPPEYSDEEFTDDDVVESTRWHEEQSLGLSVSQLILLVENQQNKQWLMEIHQSMKEKKF